MNKAFTRENDTAADADDDEIESAPPLPAGSRNYMTPGGFARLKSELDRLVAVERPELIATVAWAASNGNRPDRHWNPTTPSEYRSLRPSSEAPAICSGLM